MLSPTKARYVQICERKASSGEANRQIADDFGVSERTIDTALAWGRRMGFFEKDVGEKLSERIAEVRNHLEYLESELRLIKRMARNRDGKRVPVPHRYTAVLSREIRETLALLLELEGIYKKSLNVSVDGAVESHTVHFYLPDNGRGDAIDGN